MIRTSAPASPLVSLAEAKLHCRVDHNDEDALIQSCVDAAEAWIDGFDGVLGRCALEQTWQASADEVRCGISVHDVLSQEDNPDGSRDYVCAMPAAKVPTVRQAVLLMAAHFYENRQAAYEGGFNEAPLAVRSLLSSVRIW